MPYPEIYLVRHGETDWNRQRRLIGQAESDLTADGVRQVQRVAERLALEVVGRADLMFYSSPLKRCLQTTAIICERLAWDFDTVRFDARLKERHVGRWQGLTEAEVATRFPDDEAAHLADPDGYAMPDGGESFQDLTARLEGWLDQQPTEACIVAVGHADAGRALRGVVRGLEAAKARALETPHDAIVHLKDGAETVIGPGVI